MCACAALDDERRQEWTELAAQHATLLADKATAALPAASLPVTSVVGQSDSLDSAVVGL